MIRRITNTPLSCDYIAEYLMEQGRDTHWSRANSTISVYRESLLLEKHRWSEAISGIFYHHSRMRDPALVMK